MNRFALSLAAVLALATLALAGTVQPLSVQRLTERAELVAQIEITAVDNEVESGRPYYRATARVVKTHKGSPDDAIIIRTPGGPIGDHVMIIPGLPVPKVGNEYLAFLEPVEPGQAAYRPVGLGQGLFRLLEKNGELYAVQCMAQAPRRFAECSQTEAACLESLNVIAGPHVRLVEQISAALETDLP